MAKTKTPAPLGEDPTLAKVAAIAKAKGLDLKPVDELRDRVVRGCEDEAGSRTIADLVRERDRALVELLRMKHA